MVKASLLCLVEVMIRLERKRRCLLRGELVILSESHDRTSKEEAMP